MKKQDYKETLKYVSSIWSDIRINPRMSFIICLSTLTEKEINGWFSIRGLKKYAMFTDNSLRLIIKRLEKSGLIECKKENGIKYGRLLDRDRWGQLGTVLEKTSLRLSGLASFDQKFEDFCQIYAVYPSPAGRPRPSKEKMWGKTKGYLTREYVTRDKVQFMTPTFAELSKAIKNFAAGCKNGMVNERYIPNFDKFVKDFIWKEWLNKFEGPEISAEVRDAYNISST